MTSRGRLSTALGLAVAVPVVTACSEESSTPRAAVSPPGETADASTAAATVDGSEDLILDVDLEGRRMHVTCFGPRVASEPIVLFEPGGGSPSDTRDAVLDAPGPLFGDAPLVVLSASESRVPFADLPSSIVEEFYRIWHEEQQALAEESTDGSYEVVAGSRHNMQVEQPGARIMAPVVRRWLPSQPAL